MVEDIAANAEASRNGEGRSSVDASAGGNDGGNGAWSCVIFVDDDNDRRIVGDVLQYGCERTMNHAFDQMLRRRWTAWRATSGAGGG
jgi:hypothetical protein